jgi:hypothetical protein
MYNLYKKRIQNNSGQIALETLIVLLPWFVVAVMFFNLLFFLGSLMLTQSTVNRSALQIAAIGCVPNDLRSEIQSRSGLGITNINVVALSPRPLANGRADLNWVRDNHLDNQGNATINSFNNRVPNCQLDPQTSRPRSVIPSGSYIYVQASYQQRLIVLAPLAALGMSDTVDVHRSALTVSTALEGGG